MLLTSMNSRRERMHCTKNITMAMRLARAEAQIRASTDAVYLKMLITVIGTL